VIFNTWVYGLFCLVTFIVYWFCVPQKWRSHVLLIGSYLFFTYNYPLNTLLIVFMTISIYYLSMPIFRNKPHMDAGVALPWYKHPKFYLVVSIVFALGVLSYYKYLKMVIFTLDMMLHWVGKDTTYGIPSIVVPLGISFFVFEFVHYTVDVYKGKAEKTGLFQFAVFIMYFPTLVSGPIKRYESFNEQRKSMGNFDKTYLYEGFARILVGLGKKVVIADQMTRFSEPLLHPAIATPGQLWIGMYAYAIKIYFDFSGYSDIAIGSAKLFGYAIPENFNYPYFQRNLQKFWNNWHMSLSSWIRDYVYIPLGGNRGGPRMAARNSLLAMAISGLWHGAAWHFVFWGLYHGVGLVFLRYYGRFRKGKLPQFLPAVSTGGVLGHLPSIRTFGDVFGILLTFQYVCFGWIFFYCDFSTSFQDLAKMLGV